jgi:DNA invertase Pin-like site-specific DNA recombinase
MLGIYCRTSKDSETSIEQQKKLGIAFAVNKGFEFKVYEDEGISGFKISDDDIDPFNNRPAFTGLINDIRSKAVTKVWVFEHTRLSRNQYASAAIFNIFVKHGVELYENDRPLDLNDPQYQMFRQILDAVSQYERHLIVNRTTRGLRHAIDNGKRGYSNFEGYRKAGKNRAGRTVWEPVKAEIEKIRLVYKRYSEGATFKTIMDELLGGKKISVREVLTFMNKLGRYVKHPEYTGHVLTTEGLDVLHKFDNFEIDSISVLSDPKYWVKSIPYPLELVSIPEWIKCREKFQINRELLKKQRKGSRRAGKDLATGIVQCGTCGLKYYAHFTRRGKETTSPYRYYKHLSVISSQVCEQRPKTITIDKLNEIFKLFYFYNYLVFDNSKESFETSLRQIERQQTETEEKIKDFESVIKKHKKQIERFDSILSESDDKDTITVLSRQIISLEEKQRKDAELLASSKIELEKLNQKYSGTMREKVYYNVKDRITNFFSSTTEERRTQLLNVIEKCVLKKNYLFIDTGKIVFLFDTTIKYRFDTTFLDHLDNTEHFKWQFLELEKTKDLDDWVENEMTAEGLNELYFYENEVRMINGFYINFIDVSRNDKKLRSFFKEWGVSYDCTDRSYFVPFVDIGFHE